MGITCKWALDPGSEMLRIRFCETGETVTFPACAVFEENGQTVALGEAALVAEDRLPPGLRWSRPFVRGTITDENDATALLSAALERNGSKHSGKILGAVALSDTLTGVQVNAWKRVLKRCGTVQMRRVLPEMALAAASDKPSGCMVDAGARSTELLIYENRSIVFSARLENGLSDWDDVLIRFCRIRHRLRIGHPTASWMRLRLGCALPRKEIWRSEYMGIDLSEGLPVRRAIDSDIVYEALNDSVEAWCQEVAGRLLPRLSKKEDILLVGGGSAFFGLADRLSAVCNRPVYIPASATFRKLLGICRIEGGVIPETELPDTPAANKDSEEQ
ncbi:MAG: rod shape-determining protein [Christensenellales bacterium]|jgi:actin-like ATPase involved in cell morphogenesis